MPVADDNQQRDDHEAQTTTCPVCGAPVEPEDRFCRNCGAAVRSDEAPIFSGPEPGAPADAPTERLDTFTFSGPPPPEHEQQAPLQGPAPPPATGGPPAPAEHAQMGSRSPSSRTWWVVLLIIVLLIIVCCCLILAAFAIASSDSSFQEDVSAVAAGWFQG